MPMHAWTLTEPSKPVSRIITLEKLSRLKSGEALQTEGIPGQNAEIIIPAVQQGG